VPSTNLTRRSFLSRSAVGIAGVIGGSSLLEACGSSSSSSSATAGSSATATNAASASLGTVAGIVWKGYDNPAAFTDLKAHGLKTQWEYISASNNEIITKLRGGAKGSIDVVTPGAVFLPAMVEAGLLDPIDLSKVPNVKSLYPQFQDPSWAQVDGKTYGVPITFYDFPVNSRPDIVAQEIATYKELAGPKYKGKLVTVNDPQNLYLMLKDVLGTSDFSQLTKAQLDQGVALFRSIKPNLVTIAASFGDVIDLMSRGDAGLCILGYGLVQSTLLSRNIKCTNYAPTKTGTLTGVDLYCIAADAPNSTGSYAVLNAVLAPRGNSLMSSFQYTGVTNPAAVALLPKNQRTLFPYNDLNSYFATSPLWKSPPPTVSDSKLASQTDVTNAWTTLSS
jgi:spermidine/putrescine transport system substrate-binding protein